ncbi:MAG: hypothetical protein PQJ59_02150 [Spirochaetales bacterium]|nr:hypothetical protein [Spirochaetales bacterium]
MTTKRIFAILFIFMGALVAWMILGAANLSRTDSSSYTLRSEVASLYGGDLVFETPKSYRYVESTHKEWAADGTEIEKITFSPSYLEPLKSDVFIDVSLDQRKRGNLWFPTFKADFSGEYLFKADEPDEAYYLRAALGSSDSIYKNIQLAINGELVSDLLPLIRGEQYLVTPDEEGYVRVNLSYQSTGMENLYYYISPDYQIAQLNDFNLTIRTDFEDFDFPATMMSPGEKVQTDEGFELIWSLDQAVTGKDLGLIIPNKLNPGDIVPRVTFFAPVPLLFFFTVLLILTSLLNCSFHPMHYFFLAATFFSFHLMYSYFSDHMNLYLTFGVASLISLVLTVTYLRLFAPPKVAYLWAPLTQFVYLVMFSFSFFFDGFTGLILTVCSVLTLFVLMQLTGRVDWEKMFT